MKITFEDTTKTRLDAFLTTQLPISRSQIQKLITSGQISVNKEVVTKHHWLHSGDIIEYTKKDITDRSKVIKFKPNKDVKINVLHEDPNYIIIEKQTELLVHPTDRGETDTLANGLLAKYPKIKGVGDQENRPGIVHRLDKKVSGLLLVTKNQEAFEYYKNLFKNREINKIYFGLVHGNMEEPHGEINLPIARSKSKHGRMAAQTVSTVVAKDALTKYELLKMYTHFSYLQIEIETGRTHQIRVHMNAIGHPIVGDPLYKQKNVKQHIDLDRPFLHAGELSFLDQSGELQKFTSPLPPELHTILEKLK